MTDAIQSLGAASTTDPVARLAAKLQNHPRMVNAALHYAKAMSSADWRGTPELVSKVMSQGPRIRLVLYVLWLHFIADPDDLDSGPTLGRIMDICAVRGELNESAVRAMLGLMRLGGYIKLVHGSRDRRLKIFTPTVRLIDTVKDMFTRSFEAFDIIFDGANWAERARADEAFFREIYVACGRPFVEGEAMLTERFPALHALMAMGGGFTVLLRLFIAEVEREQSPSTVTIQRATSIPRTQIWRVIRKAAELELIDVDEAGKVVDMSRFRTMLTDYVATEIAYYAVQLQGRHMRSIELSA